MDHFGPGSPKGSLGKNVDEFKGNGKTITNKRCDQKKKWTDSYHQFHLQLQNHLFGVYLAPAYWQGQHTVQKEL